MLNAFVACSNYKPEISKALQNNQTTNLQIALGYRTYNTGDSMIHLAVRCNSMEVCKVPLHSSPSLSPLLPFLPSLPPPYSSAYASVPHIPHIQYRRFDDSFWSVTQFYGMNKLGQTPPSSFATFFYFYFFYLCFFYIIYIYILFFLYLYKCVNVTDQASVHWPISSRSLDLRSLY